MIKEYKEVKNKKEKTVLIAPSWQKDNIVDLCLDEILDNIKDEKYKIIVRPHPQHVRHMKEKFEKDPAGTVKTLIGNIPPEQQQAIVEGVKTKINLDKLGGGLGGLFGGNK